MAIDVDRLPVLAVAGEVRNVVGTVELLDAPHHGIERPVHHQARHVPFGKLELLMRRLRMAEIERHRRSLVRRLPDDSTAAGSKKIRWRCRSKPANRDFAQLYQVLAKNINWQKKFGTNPEARR